MKSGWQTELGQCFANQRLRRRPLAAHSDFMREVTARRVGLENRISGSRMNIVSSAVQLHAKGVEFWIYGISPGQNGFFDGAIPSIPLPLSPSLLPTLTVCTAHDKHLTAPNLPCLSPLVDLPLLHDDPSKSKYKILIPMLTLCRRRMRCGFTRSEKRT